MRGILSAAAYLPRGRLDRSSIAPFVGTGGGRGTRTVASYDEDTTTMAVEAGRLALHSTSPAVRPEALWFATVAPAYLDKTNATAVHAALRLDHDVTALDVVLVTSTHARAARSLASRLGTAKEALADDLSAMVGNTGAAHPALLLTRALESATPGQVIALVVLADGADVLLFRATKAISSWRPARTVDAQVKAGTEVPYGKFLAWRGMLPVEPPRRPYPQRVSASAAGRREDWKFAFVGRRDPETGEPQLPPLPGGVEPVPMADVEGTIVTFTVDRIAYSPSPPR